MQLPNYGEDKWSKKYIFLNESRVEYQSNFTIVYRPWNLYLVSCHYLSGRVGKGGRISGDHSFFQEKRGGGISLRQQSIKGRLEKIDCQLTANVRVGDQ